MKILFCHCANSDVIDSSVKQAVRAMLEKQAHVIAVSDLCRMAAEQDTALAGLTACDLVIACYPRAVRALFRAAGYENGPAVRYFNMRAEAPDQLAEILPEPAHSAEKMKKPVLSEDWPPWFPVIDRERCKNCGQCMSFCLFGTYVMDGAGQVQVGNPAHCKNLCPACARICPEAAIIFPKAAESPINGDDITDEEAMRDKIRVNVDQILGDDVYAALAERRRKAKTLRLRREAEAERAQFLKDKP